MLVKLLSSTSFSEGASILFTFLLTFGLGVVPAIITLASRSWKARRLLFAGPLLWSLAIAGVEFSNGDYGTSIVTVAMLGVTPLILMWLTPVQKYVNDYSSTWYLIFSAPRHAGTSDATLPNEKNC